MSIGYDRDRAARAAARAARTFEAKFRSTCPACDELIQPGDLCRWDDEHVFIHADCPEPPPDAPTTEVCGVCFLAVAVSGACGCEDS